MKKTFILLAFVVFLTACADPEHSVHDSGIYEVRNNFVEYLNVKLVNGPIVNVVNASCPDIDNLWSHIYEPTRLQVINKCVNVSGTVTGYQSRPDGDYHLHLKIDGQDNQILAELICVNANYSDSCKGYTNNLTLPHVGDHVTLVGSYVKDVNEHLNWYEIHPVQSITEYGGTKNG